MEAPMTAADVAAVMGNRNQDNWAGGSGMWIFALIILFGFMRGGWGGNEGACVTEAGLCNANNFTQLENAVGRGFDQQTQFAFQNQRDMCTSTATLSGQMRDGFAAAAAAQAECCCTTQRAIDGVNYNMAIGNCEIKTAIHEEGEKTRNLIQANKIEAMQAELSELKNQAALDRATCGMIRYPQQMTWAVPFPQFGNDCCCNGQRAWF